MPYGVLGSLTMSNGTTPGHVNGGGRPLVRLLIFGLEDNVVEHHGILRIIEMGSNVVDNGGLG